MGKALLVGALAAIASNEETNLFGIDGSTTESQAQVVATEQATFSKLGVRITSGGSGTNNCTFRNNSANGNQATSIVGSGTQEDGSNTDTVSAGNPFNLAMTDNGTDPVYTWVKANVEFASGHGSFHCAGDFNPLAFDLNGATRYLPINGGLGADGTATEANVAWKVREYTSAEAIQVNVTANARTTDTTFTLRVNGADTAAVITVAAGVTGIVTSTALGISLSPGDLVCIKIVYGSGTDVMRISQAGVTFKSTGNGSEIAAGTSAGLARTASSTASYIVVGGEIGFGAVEADHRVKVGFAARCKNLRCYLSANTYTADATLSLMVNGVAQITTTLTASGGAGWYENTSDTFDIDDNDEISFELDEGTSGSITVHQIGVSFAEISGGGGVVIPIFDYYYRTQRA
jgi:hypothetical protein